MRTDLNVIAETRPTIQQTMEGLLLIFFLVCIICGSLVFLRNNPSLLTPSDT